MSGFLMIVINPNLSVTSLANQNKHAMNQSALRARACNQRQARENASRRDCGLALDWLIEATSVL